MDWETKIVIVAVSVLFVVLLVVLFVFPYLIQQSTLEGYAVYLDKSDTPPADYITINSTDIEEYPFLAWVIDAYDHPGNYRGARMYGDTLIYEILEKDLEDQVKVTHDYLLDRFWRETESHEGEVAFSYTFPGNGETYYYFWSVAVA
ncbi:MAG: hypothetical protein JSV43_03800 [Methanobacteriota archaeon]|nr:MAG: hypothetical protein JSV43_03800 [Euryarchaeota archaeon]